MNKPIILLLLLVGIAGYGQQYPTPVKLRTITMRDSYKGSSIRAYRVIRNYNKSDTYYMPIDAPPQSYEALEPLPVYYNSETNNDSPYHISENGKVYIWVTSERGVTYKKYIL